MGKRSNFLRRKNDDYPSPHTVVKPLLPFLDPETMFMEPCAGEGLLIHWLEREGHICVGAWDKEVDARTNQYGLRPDVCFITNPPWTRELLHPIIDNLRTQAPTWLLFDADWMHTKQAAPYLPFCALIISVGRVKWIPDSPYVGKDNCCWYLFGTEQHGTEFIGQQ